MMNLIVHMEEKGLSSEQAQMIFRCFACSRARNAGKHWPGNDHQEIGNQEKRYGTTNGISGIRACRTEGEDSRGKAEGF